ncbi:hypothetical protein FGO68_gene13701 [Halteria grandinella]|uniref:Uncharacterized protein n=1 Tax=Halteria grandinella TaxID=5974 RepID=A0A8J8P6D3_HALGN|nr:hypothetical protein FGO68_gene13701 [Halteria grandinella]
MISERSQNWMKVSMAERDVSQGESEGVGKAISGKRQFKTSYRATNRSEDNAVLKKGGLWLLGEVAGVVPPLGETVKQKSFQNQGNIQCLPNLALSRSYLAQGLMQRQANSRMSMK